MSSLYRTTVDAVLDVLKPALAPAGFGVVRRTRPQWVALLDTLPAVCVAPNEGMIETVQRLTFDNIAVLGFEVYVGVFVDDRAEDAEQAWRIAEAREQIRLMLWEPEVLGLRQTHGEFDVTFDPTGGAGMPPPANVRGSWMLFRFDFKTQRSWGRGR